jgi:hypothetical protein
VEIATDYEDGDKDDMGYQKELKRIVADRPDDDMSSDSDKISAMFTGRREW